MLEQLLPQRLSTAVMGDGAGDMVQAIGSRDDDGRITVLAWNGTVDVTMSGGDPLLDRVTSLTISGLTAPRYRIRHRRLDAAHSNLVAAWADEGGGADWPNKDQWTALAAGNHLEDLEEEQLLEATNASLEPALGLPMPSVSLIELEPA